MRLCALITTSYVAKDQLALAGQRYLLMMANPTTPNG